MNESNREGRSSISGAATVEEIGEFRDSHSLADDAEEAHEVSFELRVVSLASRWNNRPSTHTPAPGIEAPAGEGGRWRWAD